MSLWFCEKLTIHISFNDSAALSVYPHPYLFVQYHPYVLHWFHPYDLANPCVWIPGVRWSFPHTPCNVVYIAHNIVQSMLYFNIHVVMMYVLYTQTWITFVYFQQFFPVFSPSSTGISSSKLPSFDIIFLVDILYKTSYHLCLLPTVFFPVSSPPSTRISHFKLSSFKTIVMTYVYTTSAHLRFNTSNSLFQFAVLIFTGISFQYYPNFLFYEQF